MPLDILLVEDEPTLLAVLGDELAEAGHRVTRCKDGLTAGSRLRARAWDLLISDVRLPGQDGYSLAELALSQDPPVEVILMTAYGAVDRAVEMLKRGVRDYLSKPFDERILVDKVASVEERLGESVGGLASFVAVSDEMTRLVHVLDRVARCEENVLVSGEMGTGKALVGRMLHARSGRSAGPLLVVNCAAVPAESIEHELFGDADGKTGGWLAAAEGGSLLLEEVGGVPTSVQGRLLRSIEAQGATVLGPGRGARILASTSRDLRAEAAGGRFREDLLIGLSTFELEVPPLRDRVEDVLPLVLSFLEEIRSRMPDAPRALDDEARMTLTSYDWPGNVRELRSAISHAAVLATDDLLRRSHLPGRVRGDVATEPSMALRDALGRVEAQQIRRALGVAGGSRTRTAALLGISRKHLWELMKRHGIQT